MRRTLFFAFSLVALVGVARESRADEISLGIFGGLNFAHLVTGNDNDIAGSTTHTGTRLGLAGGLALDLPISQHFAFAPQVMYLQKGGTVASGNTIINYRFDTIEVPLLMKMKFGNEHMRLAVFAGPSIGIGIKRDAVADDNGTGTAIPADLTRETSGTEFSIHVGSDIEFPVGETTNFVLGMRYMQGITNILRHGGATYIRNQGVLATGGLQFEL